MAFSSSRVVRIWRLNFQRFLEDGEAIKIRRKQVAACANTSIVFKSLLFPSAVTAKDCGLRDTIAYTSAASASGGGRNVPTGSTVPPNSDVMHMENARSLRSIACIALSGLLLSIGLSAEAGALEIGRLPFDKCTDLTDDDFSEKNQRYWFARVPPYVGFSKGEETRAGGDETCYVGFPFANKESALVLVDGAMVEIFPVASVDKDASVFMSADHGITVEVRITGGESTCMPDSESCCGDFVYATITVMKNGAVKIMKAANYKGG